MNKLSNKALIAAVALGVIGFGAYYSMSSGMFLSGEAKTTFQNNKVVQDARGLMALPDETPVIFEVKDATEIQKQQPFFQGVTTGDKLMIFPKQAKAVIYSPSRNVIVNAGPINFDQAAANANPSLQASPTNTTTQNTATPGTN